MLGRIRNTRHCTSDVEANSTVQSLNILNPKLSKDPSDRFVCLNLSHVPHECLNSSTCRTLFQFEAAWDSSLHNSVLLNR